MINQGVYSNPLVSAYRFPAAMIFSLVKAFGAGTPHAKIYEQFWPQGEGGDLACRIPIDRLPQPPSRKTAVSAICSQAALPIKITDWMNVADASASITPTVYIRKTVRHIEPHAAGEQQKGKYTETRGEERQTYGDVMLNPSARRSKRMPPLDAHIGARRSKDNRFDELGMAPLPAPSQHLQCREPRQEPEETPKNRLARTNAVVFLTSLNWAGSRNCS